MLKVDEDRPEWIDYIGIMRPYDIKRSPEEDVAFSVLTAELKELLRQRPEFKIKLCNGSTL